MDELRRGPKFEAAALDWLKICVMECIDKYGDDYQYSTDPRLLKIWILCADAIGDFDKVYRQLEEKKNVFRACTALRCICTVSFSKGEVLEACKVYELGISRKAEPLDHLKKTHTIFLKHLEKIVEEADADAQPKPSKIQKKEPILLDPWSESTMNNLLENINVDLKKFAGYHQSNKVYHGKGILQNSVPLCKGVL
ncbi:mitotic checkpoint serine/threonine-protein kinase BUB1-like [Oryza glaberrima]|uniref:mitotic checkpoint serine/threonine-protein kinase BUB1-like n=1 Tax=Oryza glaberrima TaxID=4538 RepID=UPI00224C1A58|nr:mitotic checkpoint serine/threonine-protein kinase BUB1-like [Oryza glaberrima]